MHPYDDPSSNRCIRRPRMHPQPSACAHSPKALVALCVPRARDGHGRNCGKEGRDGQEDVVGSYGGRMEDGRNEQQSMRNSADAQCLVPLLSTSVVRVHGERPCSSLLPSSSSRSPATRPSPSSITAGAAAEHE